MSSFTKKELQLLKRLNTPIKIQDYLDTLPFNHEDQGETCYSPRNVMIHKTAHCMEGALFAACALTHAGRTPYILSLRVLESDYDHALALYKENGHWGAISKTNHAVLQFRDPIYKTVRELALSYFHEYFLTKNGVKTLRGYSRPVNLKRFGTSWMTSSEPLFEIAEAIYDAHHTPIIPKGNEKLLRKATSLERKTASISCDGR